MDEELFPSEILERVNKSKLDNGKDNAKKDITIINEKITKISFSHKSGIGILIRSVVTMVPQVIVFKRNISDDKRNHHKGAGPKILPLFLEKSIVSALMHKGDNSHLNIANDSKTKDLDPKVG